MEQQVAYKIGVFLENVYRLCTLKKPTLFGETQVWFWEITFSLVILPNFTIPPNIFALVVYSSLSSFGKLK